MLFQLLDQFTDRFFEVNTNTEILRIGKAFPVGWKTLPGVFERSLLGILDDFAVDPSEFRDVGTTFQAVESDDDQATAVLQMCFLVAAVIKPAEFRILRVLIFQKSSISEMRTIRKVVEKDKFYIAFPVNLHEICSSDFPIKKTKIIF